MISEAHKNRLLLHYGIDPDRPEIKAMEETGLLRSATSQEIKDLSGWEVEGSGMIISYPGKDISVIRPDTPPAEGPKYLHPKESLILFIFPQALTYPQPRSSG